MGHQLGQTHNTTAFPPGSWELSRLQPGKKAADASAARNPHDNTDTTALDQLLATLAQIIDPRKRRGVRYSMVCLLAFAVITVLARATNYRQLGDRARDLPAPLPRLLGAPIGPTGRYRRPEESTLRRVLGQTDADQLDRVIGDWLLRCTRPDPEGGEQSWQLHLDGKTLRGSYNDQGQIKLFSTFESTSGVVAAQVDIPQDSQENTREVEVVLGRIETDLAGAVITADAAHTHARTARHVVADHQADYVFTVATRRISMRHCAPCSTRSRLPGPTMSTPRPPMAGSVPGRSGPPCPLTQWIFRCPAEWPISDNFIICSSGYISRMGQGVK